MSENKTAKKIIALFLTISLITTSMFAVTWDSVNAEENTEVTANAEEQIDELTETADPDAEYDGFIIAVKDSKTGKVDEKEASEYESTPDNKYIMVDEPEEALDFIDPDYIDFIEPNYKRYATAETVTLSGSDIQTMAYATTTYNVKEYNLINVNTAWANGFTGTGAKVAVFDTGLYYNNTAFTETKLNKYYNFYGSYNPYFGIVNKTIISSPTSAIDDYYNNNGTGHGTAVTGLIAAKGTQALQGIAYNSTIDTAKIMDSKGDGSVGDMLQGMYIYLNQEGAPDVINMSFGAQGYSEAEYNILYEFSKRGTILIAASGNSGEKGSPYEYPANYENVIAVGSVNANGNPSSFSTANSSVVVSAPGNYVFSAMANSSEGAYYQGTSFSSPIVAGVAALVRQTEINITREQFLTLLKETSKDVYKNGYDIYTGYGVIDIDELTRTASSGGIEPSYKIAYETDGGTITDAAPVTIHTKGDTTTLTKKVSKTGYNFSHWVDESGEKITSILSSYSDGDITLTAKYTPKTYKLKFKGNGGTVKTSTKAVKYNTAIGSLKTPKKRKGYNFLGWFTKKKGGTQYYKGKKYTTAGNLKLYAHWTKKKIVKFNANGGTVKKYAKAIKKGKKYGTLPKPTRSGYTFKGWYTKKKGGQKITKNSKVAKNKNYTLYARWKKK